MDKPNFTDTHKVFWNNLHSQKKFLPAYPNEDVIRFLCSRRKENNSDIKALDIGVGGGRHTKLLSEMGFDTFGIDVSKNGLNYTHKMLSDFGLNATLNQASMADIPHSDNFFDVAISFGVYNYGTSEETKKAISELYRTLKPDGSGFVVMRSTNDFRFGKGEAIEKTTFVLNISETNELGTTQHFLLEQDVEDYFSMFSKLTFEINETTFANRTQRNSDWLITVVK